MGEKQPLDPVDEISLDAHPVSAYALICPIGLIKRHEDANQDECRK